MKPSTALELRRDAVREAAPRFRASNLRVFGSALHGSDREDSDLDLLVDAMPGATLFDLGGLQIELEELLGVPVDLRTPGDLPPRHQRARLCRGTPRMTEDRLPDYLEHIRQAAEDALLFVDGMSKENFLEDRRTQ